MPPIVEIRKIERSIEVDSARGIREASEMYCRRHTTYSRNTSAMASAPDEGPGPCRGPLALRGRTRHCAREDIDDEIGVDIPQHEIVVDETIFNVLRQRWQPQ